MSKLKGLATGIGSLPHKDTDSALDLIFRYAPNIPFWPQLPKRNVHEGMVDQFMQKLPIPHLLQGDTLTPNASTYPSLEERLEEFYEKIINQDLDYFQIEPDYAVGLYAFKERLEKEKKLLENIEFIKCQVIGPFTFAASIKDKDGLAYLHDSVIMQVIIKGLTMKALWQIKFFQGFNKKIIMFLDEPYLGCFGSAYTPINKEDVAKGLTEITEGIKTDNVLLGLHCCGNTDWSIFTDIKTLDIISFDAFSFLDKFILYADNLKEFISRGGIICWGIVPTQEFSGNETPDLLVGKLWDGINALVKKGLDRDLLLENLIISPACGLGTLDTKKSEGIFKLLSETSSFIRK